MARMATSTCSRSGTHSSPWRLSRFFPPLGGGLFGAGTMDFSPGWFQRLHDVSSCLEQCWPKLILGLKKLTDRLYVSTDLRSEAAGDFLRSTYSLSVLCNAMTALVASQQYDSGQAAIQKIKDGKELDSLHPNLGYWHSIWSGFSLIVNRMTVFHRDPGASAPCFDLLISGGTHSDCKLELPDIGATLSYAPGTGVFVTGRVLRHGVKSWSGGERICLAHFMKDIVHDRLGQPRPEWTNIDDFLEIAFVA